MSLRKLRVLLLRISAAPVVFLAVFVRPSWSVDSNVSVAVELAGYLFLLAGLAIRMWSILYIGARKSRELITEGPYSLCRNPLYIGTFLVAIGAGLCFENVLMLAATVAVVVPVHFLVVRLEERHLESRFPADYGLYKQRVPRFLPRLGSYQSREELVISVRAIRRAAVDAIGVLLIPAIEDLLELLHQAHIIPVLWHFP